MRVFVTVGMGPWPFDRLVSAVGPLTAEHDVFVQRGSSSVRPDCAHQDYLTFGETIERITWADVIISHAGNTIRLVQRAGKVPIGVAREARRGEMRNDHQCAYLAREVAACRAVAAHGDLTDLRRLVIEHPDREGALLVDQAPESVADPATTSLLLDRLLSTNAGNPLAGHPLRRLPWAYEQLSIRTGRHLELGVGDGRLLRALADHTALQCVGADPHPGYLATLRGDHPDLALVRVGVGQRLPFHDAAFDSVSALDVIEHTPDEESALREVRRVLRPGGLLVLSVPARHVFSAFDPDNAKLRHPRLHRLVYSTRFGAAAYTERFVDNSDGLRGDMAWSRTEHTNYRATELISLLTACGFMPEARDGANLFWRWLQVPQLLLPGRLGRWLDAPLRLDAHVFRSANLFLTARAATTYAEV
ncbi:MAG: methyltransferase domain-containing protein [Actinomycetes bacterium]